MPDVPNSQHDRVADLPLHCHVERTIRQYFAELDGDMPSNLYELIVIEVERPLLNVVMELTANNQSQAAKILGLNRGTLRKKLLHHGLI